MTKIMVKMVVLIAIRPNAGVCLVEQERKACIFIRCRTFNSVIFSKPSLPNKRIICGVTLPNNHCCNLLFTYM